MNKVSGGSEQLKRADAKSYDATATDFDKLTDHYSTAIASRMLAIGKVGSSDRLLDLGTGTGLVARLAAVRGASVMGIDHSEGMLGRARIKADEAGVAPIATFEAMDAEALALENSSFDVAASLYVIRHLPIRRPPFTSCIASCAPAAGWWLPLGQGRAHSRRLQSLPGWEP